jgi:hypothetical protein
VHQDAASATRHKFFEDIHEMLRHTLERAQNGFVLPLIEHLDRILDRFCPLVDFFLLHQQFFSVVAEIAELV